METFSEFKTLAPNPQKETGSIISHSFEIFKRIFGYSFLALLVYFIASMVIRPISGFNDEALMELIQNSNGNITVTDILAVEGLQFYYILSFVFGLLAMPLFLGITYLSYKANHRLPMSFGDLFIGYKRNFVNIIIYNFISSIILSIAFSLCVLPGFFVAPLLFLGYPILLFENASFSEALSKSFNIAKENYGVMLGTSILGILISFAGVFLCGVGILFTALFFYIVMYSTYVAFVGEPKSIS